MAASKVTSSSYVPGILGPVPCLHIGSAVALSNTGSEVAFGTSCLQFVEQLDDNGLDEGAPVLIYASKSDDGDPDARRLYFRGTDLASWCGEFVRWTRALGSGRQSGRHPNPDVRPVSTDTDSAFIGIYEVRNLTPISLALSDVRKVKGSGVIGRAPEWPAIVRVPTKLLPRSS